MEERQPWGRRHKAGKYIQEHTWNGMKVREGRTAGTKEKGRKAGLSSLSCPPSVPKALHCFDY